MMSPNADCVGKPTDTPTACPKLSYDFEQRMQGALNRFLPPRPSREGAGEKGCELDLGHKTEKPSTLSPTPIKGESVVHVDTVRSFERKKRGMAYDLRDELFRSRAQAVSIPPSQPLVLDGGTIQGRNSVAYCACRIPDDFFAAKAAFTLRLRSHQGGHVNSPRVPSRLADPAH